MGKINKTWVLIIILIILTGVLIAISVYSKEIETNLVAKPSPIKNVEKEVAFTTLKISDEPRVSTISGRYEIDIIINTNENQITQTQIELAYNPTQLKIYGIKPGTFISSPVIVQKNIDAENGRISYWLGVKPEQKFVMGNGDLATITFAKIGTGSAEINFEPKSSVNAFGIDESVLKDSVSGFINELPTKTPTPSRIFPTITNTPLPL